MMKLPFAHVTGAVLLFIAAGLAPRQAIAVPSPKDIATGLALATAPAATKTSLPNVLLIVVDDLGYGELGCLGNPHVPRDIPTPHMDALARTACFSPPAT